MKSLLALPLVLTGVTAETRAKYDLKPGASCAEGYVPLTTSWHHCATGARSLGFEGDSVKYVKYNKPWGTKRPQGCFRKGNGEFHFNDGAGGNSRAKDQILCILESQAPRAAGSSLETGGFTATSLEEAGPDGSAPAMELPEWEAEAYGEDVEVSLAPPGNDTESLLRNETEAEGGYWTPRTGWTKEPPEASCSVPQNRLARRSVTNKKPWKWIAKLYIKARTGNWFVCTGFFISKRVLMTNAHCTYMHSEGGWAKSIKVCPGKNFDHLPFGCQYITRMSVKQQWIDVGPVLPGPVWAALDVDYSAIWLPDDKMYKKGVGYFGYQTSFSGISGVNTAGYPSALDGGQALWSDYGGCYLEPTYVRYSAYISRGMSGGPLWAYWKDSDKRRAVGLISHDGCSHQYGVRITKSVFDFMTKYRERYG